MTVVAPVRACPDGPTGRSAASTAAPTRISATSVMRRARELGAARGSERDRRPNGGAEYSGKALAATARETGHAASGPWTGTGSARAQARARGCEPNPRRERRAGPAQQRQQERHRHLVGGAGEVEEAAAVGLQALAADVQLRRFLPLLGDGRRARTGPSVLRGGLADRVGAGDAGAARPAAPVGAARDGGGDHVAAVAVLVERRTACGRAPASARRSSSADRARRRRCSRGGPLVRARRARARPAHEQDEE